MTPLQDIGAAQEPYWADPLKAVNVQILCLAEEAGEVVKAYRQWSGLARRNDATITNIGEELADVIITATHAAFLLGIDLDTAVWDKLDVIRERRRINDSTVVISRSGDDRYIVEEVKP